MRFTAGTVSILLLMLTASRSYASYAQFKITIPAWVEALAIGVGFLLATPLLWSLWLLGKRILSSESSVKVNKRLRVLAVFHFSYAFVYSAFWLKMFGDSLAYWLKTPFSGLFFVTIVCSCYID
ncbi:MAG: hypothetical protein R3F37_09870 [Candidatus Competibacteraceae bacterium]